jgi:polysaccharide biosynthesis transport protein
MKTRAAAIPVAALCAALLSGCSENGLGGKYTSTSTLRVSRQTPFIVYPPAHQDSEKEYDVYKKTQAELVKGRFVLLAALRKPEVAKLPAVQRECKSGDDVKWLKGLVKVEFPGDAELMTVSVTTGDPQESVALARAVVDAYLTEVVNVERDRKRVRLSELDRAFVENETDVRCKTEDLKKLAEQLGTSDSGTLTLKQQLALEELTIYRQEMAKIQHELGHARGELAARKASLKGADAAHRPAILDEIKRLEVEVAAAGEQSSAVERQVVMQKREAEKFGGSTVDIEMMRAEIKNQETVLAEISKERQRLKIEIRASPRVTLLERADVPESKD